MAKQAKSNGDQLDFEAKLWQAADKMRNNMDAAEYKHVVLGLIFLKYISDAFSEHYAKLSATKGADAEDPTSTVLRISFMSLRKPDGITFRRTPNSLPLVRFLTKPWMKSKRVMPRLRVFCQELRKGRA